jgi:2-polyprenyl-6-methoxyphenol hydroxylase-like FAD-dependent oxidoreductase
MSPVGGVGINLAVQDAIATANILAQPLADGTVTAGQLEAVQKRRMFPTRATQRVQVVVQERVIDKVLGSNKPIGAPWPLRLFNAVPFLSRIPARVVGMGFRPEHVQTPEKALARS